MPQWMLTQTTHTKIPARVIGDVVVATEKKLGRGMVRRVDVSLIGDRAMRRLNRTYRGKDRTTDVLSFATLPDPPRTKVPRPIEGEVLISLPVAIRQARAVGHSLHAELQRLCVHGLLHLAGYDHMLPADERRMFALEDAILRLIT